jgi:predicted amidohydrolase
MVESRTVRVAAVQAESECFNLDAGVAKACKYIEEASQKGAKLVAFSECFLPGYPYWIWYETPPQTLLAHTSAAHTSRRARSVDLDYAKRYIENCLAIDSPQMQKICETAKTANIAVSLGFSEQADRSCYIAQALIGADGEIKMTRRKTKPTHMERTIFGDGSGSSLKNVVDVPGVGKVGGLCCWEHTQPLLRHHTHSLGEEIHVAAWPPQISYERGKVLLHCAAEGQENAAEVHHYLSHESLLTRRRSQDSHADAQH